MGEYLQIFNQVKNDLENKNFNNAYLKLKGLLNKINSEYVSLNNGKQKEERKKALNKLIPILKLIKEEKINDLVIKTFKLEIKDEKKEAFKEPIIIPKPASKPIKKSASKELSPLTFDDYIGQEKAKMSLKISIAAAKKEERVLNHLLICSSYGLGKTTLANIIANEMEMPFFNVNASNLKDARSVSNYFSKIKESAIIFIDEIHSLKKDIQTLLLSILTDFEVNFINDEGVEESYKLPPFTLIGATTQAGELLKPFLNRFQVLELVDYNENELETIVRSKFNKLNLECSEECIKDIARRSRGIPRTIEIFIKGLRDLALTKNIKEIDMDLVNEYFNIYDIDSLGLNKNDLKILEVLSKEERPLALITLESKTTILKEDLEYRYEPYLLKLGFMEKTEKGRIITAKGRDYLLNQSSGLEE